jgi:hypothetical protein
VFELVETRIALMLSHLAGDRAGVERAIAAVSACQSSAISEDEIACEIAADMREMLGLIAWKLPHALLHAQDRRR